MSASSMRDLAQALTATTANLGRRQAVVTALGTSPSSVTILLGGSTTPITGVRYLAAYTPAIGDVVWILQDGPDLLVLGKLA